MDEVLGDGCGGAGLRLPPPTTITTAPNSGAGPTCCGTSTTCRASTPWAEAVHGLYADQSLAQAKLCRRIERHIKELFVFVGEPAAPSDNNAAERSLRHLVVSRQRGRPVSARDRHQDDLEFPLRLLAGPRPESPRRLPPTAPLSRPPPVMARNSVSGWNFRQDRGYPPASPTRLPCRPETPRSPAMSSASTHGRDAEATVAIARRPA